MIPSEASGPTVLPPYTATVEINRIWYTPDRTSSIHELIRLIPYDINTYVTPFCIRLNGIPCMFMQIWFSPNRVQSDPNQFCMSSDRMQSDLNQFCIALDCMPSDLNQFCIVSDCVQSNVNQFCMVSDCVQSDLNQFCIALDFVQSVLNQFCMRSDCMPSGVNLLWKLCEFGVWRLKGIGCRKLFRSISSSNRKR